MIQSVFILLCLLTSSTSTIVPQFPYRIYRCHDKASNSDQNDSLNCISREVRDKPYNLNKSSTAPKPYCEANCHLKIINGTSYKVVNVTWNITMHDFIKYVDGFYLSFDVHRYETKFQLQFEKKGIQSVDNEMVYFIYNTFGSGNKISSNLVTVTVYTLPMTIGNTINPNCQYHVDCSEFTASTQYWISNESITIKDIDEMHQHLSTSIVLIIIILCCVILSLLSILVWSKRTSLSFVTKHGYQQNNLNKETLIITSTSNSSGRPAHWDFTSKLAYKIQESLKNNVKCNLWDMNSSISDPIGWFCEQIGKNCEQIIIIEPNLNSSNDVLTAAVEWLSHGKINSTLTEVFVIYFGNQPLYTKSVRLNVIMKCYQMPNDLKCFLNEIAKNVADELFDELKTLAERIVISALI